MHLQRSGSSLPAIKKYIGDHYKNKLPAHWEKMVTLQLKRLVEKGQLTKVRHKCSKRTNGMAFVTSWWGLACPEFQASGIVGHRRALPTTLGCTRRQGVVTVTALPPYQALSSK